MVGTQERPLLGMLNSLKIAVQTQGKNIRHYANYLTQRAIAYRETKFDFVRGSEGRLEKLSVDKGILREAEILQHQIAALLKCDVRPNMLPLPDMILKSCLGAR